ncbi:hypothetical protein BDQ17DRAFT_1321040 [Cyathus striatus]|nr:hypothetical protein BDQ17DRAFT_1321040 [Cyathus striatus]
MAITIAHLTVAQAATILNAIISFIQYTLGLALVALLAKFISDVNSAVTWSVITRELHTSLWPTILRTDTSHGAAPRVTFFSKLGMLSSLLVTVAGIVTPLGLKQGPPIASHYQPMDAVYIKDTSPLASATSPRSNYTYARTCGYFNLIPCPGNTEAETTEINPSIIEQFNSTPYGPFNIQFRRYFKSSIGHNNLSILGGQYSTLESFILRDGIFAVDGAIVDLTETPGIGLSNHTAPPSLKDGATWSQEMLWLEPVTTCVDTNLTIDYVLEDGPNASIDTFNLTDRGGFVGLTTQYPSLDRDGQNINLYQHAYKGAVISNAYSMIALNNLTRSQSSVGQAFPLDTMRDASFIPGVMKTLNLGYLSNVSMESGSQSTVCRGYGSLDTANITNVGVHCGAFLGPPYRSDGGDDRIQDIGSKWRQNLHVCASVTKASIQRVDYSLNGTTELSNLHVTRSPLDQPVLWAVEKTDMNITDIAIYWGRVADSYESDPSLTTVRATELYVPASVSDIANILTDGQAETVPAMAWSHVYGELMATDSLLDYSGSTNAALLNKYQTIISADPAQGIARINNLIWTDAVVNNLLSSDTSTVLTVAEYHPSISYDLKYGIPLALLVLIWLPSFTTALMALIFGMLKISYLKNLLNHTSVGKIVTGHSALAVESTNGSGPTFPIPLDPNSASTTTLIANEKDWADTAGQTLISYRPHAMGPSEEHGLLYPQTPLSAQYGSEIKVGTPH